MGRAGLERAEEVAPLHLAHTPCSRCSLFTPSLFTPSLRTPMFTPIFTSLAGDLSGYDADSNYALKPLDDLLPSRAPTVDANADLAPNRPEATYTYHEPVQKPTTPAYRTYLEAKGGTRKLVLDGGWAATESDAAAVKLTGRAASDTAAAAADTAAAGTAAKMGDGESAASQHGDAVRTSLYP